MNARAGGTCRAFRARSSWTGCRSRHVARRRRWARCASRGRWERSRTLRGGRLRRRKRRRTCGSTGLESRAGCGATLCLCAKRHGNNGGVARIEQPDCYQGIWHCKSAFASKATVSVSVLFLASQCEYAHTHEYRTRRHFLTSS